MSHDNLKKLTFEECSLGALITVIFTASNVVGQSGDDFSPPPFKTVTSALLSNFEILQRIPMYRENQYRLQTKLHQQGPCLLLFSFFRSINDGLLARIPILANCAYLCTLAVRWACYLPFHYVVRWW